MGKIVAFEITSVVVVTGRGPDHVLINTDMPDPTWFCTETLMLKCMVAAGKGKAYVLKNFGLTEDMIRVVDMGK